MPNSNQCIRSNWNQCCRRKNNTIVGQLSYRPWNSNIFVAWLRHQCFAKHHTNFMFSSRSCSCVSSVHIWEMQMKVDMPKKNKPKINTNSARERERERFILEKLFRWNFDMKAKWSVLGKIQLFRRNFRTKSSFVYEYNVRCVSDVYWTLFTNSSWLLNKQEALSTGNKIKIKMKFLDCLSQ